MLLFEKIEQFILESLRHRYDKRAPQVTFLLNKANTCSDLSNRNGQVKIKLSVPQTFQKFVYRFPQTRIYYSLYRNAQWEFKILDYFDWTLIAFENRGEAASVEFQTDETHEVYPLNREETSDLEGIYQIAPKGGDFPDASSLIHHLQTIRQAEYALHPLRFFQTNDHTLQTETDRWFAGLPLVDAAGNLMPEAVHHPGFIWLAEFYVQMGWWERLASFFNDLKKEVKITSQYLLAIRRLNTILSAMDMEPVEVPKKAIQQKEQTFLNRYFLQDERDEAFGEAVQAFWEYLQLPALRLRWERDIALNPDEFMAFVLLAIEQKFWWAPQAVSFVRSFLPEEHKVLFDLLTVKMSGIGFSTKRHALRLGTLNGQRETALQASRWSIRYYTFGKQSFSELFVQPFDLKLNLNHRIDFEVKLSQKEIRLIPIFFKPPLEVPTWRTMRIEFGDLQIEFPLVWQQATLKLNRCRLKFLRKKNRFQITVKNARNERTIKINGQPIELRPDRFAKFYWPIEKTTSRAIIQPFTPTGTRITALSLGNTAFTLRGVAFDAFGILKDRFRVSFNDARRNKGIVANAVSPEVFQAPTLPLKLKISADKCEPVWLELFRADDFWQALKNTPAERLIHELKIWIDRDETEISVSQIANLALKRLGWFPKIETINFENFIPEIETFNLLLSSTDRLKDEIIIDAGNIKVFKSNKTPKLKYLQINSKILTKLFDIEFFIQEFEKK